MKTIFRATIIISCVAAPASAQWNETEQTVLPRFETPEESGMRATYVPPAPQSVVPPANPVRTMAEFEELDGIVVRWAYNTQNLLISQIVDAAQEEGKVWILVRPGTSDSTNIKSYLGSRNIPLTNLEFLSINTNSIWCRDYGPWTVYDVTNDSIGIVDFQYNRPRPLDDVVPGALATLWNIPLYQTVQRPDSLTHTGGNFMVDGFGSGFSSHLITNENPHLTQLQVDTILARYCGLSRFVRMTTLQYDEIHHIDMHMKLLDEETLLIGQYPVNVSDYTTIENTVNYLRTLQTCYGRPYRIVRIPMPPDLSGNYPPVSNYLTYTNSVIINKTVLVPIYSLPGDQQALQIYRDAMPGYNIVGYDCNSIIPQLGAIHCITKEIGVREPVHIAHARLSSTSDTSHDYRIVSTIKARSGIDTALVFWRTDTTSAFSRTMMADSAGSFVAHIPRQQRGTTVWYYISATTGSGRTSSKPLVGPVGAFSFDVVDSSATHVRTAGVPATFLLNQNSPNPFNPATTIEYTLGTDAAVSLKIYDILGREIETLFDGTQEMGSYRAVWHATGWASGVYLYRLAVRTLDGRIWFYTRKAVLMK